MVAELLRPRNPQPLPLSELSLSLGGRHIGEDLSVSGVSLHTGLVAPGDLFVALGGVHRHGSDFWPEASARGAGAVLTDEAGLAALGDNPPPLVVVADPRAVLGAVAARIYGTEDLQALRIFSVTGTNGKTSTAYLLDALLRGLDMKTALSTTAERHVAGEAFPSTLTTPEAPDIHAMLGLAKEQNVWGVALEVSAQAIVRNRLDGVVADVAGFTNLSHDHFEDFGDMENYFHAKARLFTPQMASQAVVCIDTDWGERLAKTASIPVCTLGRVGTEPVGDRPHWVYRVISAGRADTVFSVTGPGGELTVRAPIIGDHMAANAALAIVMLIQSGVDPSAIERAVGLDTPGIPVYLPGRIERVSGLAGPQVFVDSGHTEDAYRATLTTVRARTVGRLIMVCGLSGNRDVTKRPLMGATGATLADLLIVTDGDPRKEDPAVIRAGLLEGARSVPGVEVHEIPDPSAAIRFAVSSAGEGDSVVWLGLGSKSYRDIAGEKVPYSARVQARLALGEAGWLADAEKHD
jgi:UDP-N-acetylmuramoyl-L-alanyl-D-glutamate--2,6-diaminopimelate ligase